MKTFLTKYDVKSKPSESGGVSMTDQQYRDECDIDMILKRYKVGQPLPQTARKGVYGDFSDVQDFASCLDRVKSAMDDFASLPAELRARFGNDPRAYYEYVLDPANQEECVRLGLREAPTVPLKNDVVTAPAASQAQPGDGTAVETT